MKKKVVALMLGMMVAFAGAQTVPAMAADGKGYQTAYALGTSANDYIDDETSRWYKYTMPSSGHVNFSLTNPDVDNDFALKVFDENVQEIVDYGWSNSIKTTEFAFKPGTTIYLQISYDSSEREYEDYTLRADFTSASDWENDYTNDEMSGADTLTDGVKKYGVNITGDDKDWYRFTMPAKGSVTFTIENTDSVEGNTWYLEVYNASKKEIFDGEVAYGDYSFTTESVKERSGNNVYLNVTRSGSDPCATYQITPHFTADNASADSDNSNDDSDSHDYGDEVASAPAKVTGVKISNAKGAKAKVSFTGQDVTAGYQVWYSYSGKIKRKYVYDTTSTKISVPKGKKVSVKVRAFTYDDNDERQFGAWSVTKVKKTDKK